MAGAAARSPGHLRDVAGGGLGRIITLGFRQQDTGAVLAGAILVALLAVATELTLAAVSWAVTPGPRRLPLGRVRTRRTGTVVVATGS